MDNLPYICSIKIKQNIKDYLIAREIWGTNTKEQCHVVKKLREKGEIRQLCDGWCIISNPNIDDCGLLIPTHDKDGNPILEYKQTKG